MIAARLHRPLMPWQRYVADVGLELNPDGSLVYSEVDLEVGRQEGKTELKFVIAVMRLTVFVATHGPQRVTYTMQNRKKARIRLERDYAARLRGGAGFKEIRPTSRERPRKATEWRLGMNSGVEAIQFGPESWLQIDTPSRTDGHGDTLDLGLIDEAFAHQDDTVELGMEPAMLTRTDPQLWVLSAGGDAKSVYLWRKLLRGRKLVEDGCDSGVAFFEWSAADDADPADPATWRSCCPALGFTVTEDRLDALWRKAAVEGPTAIDSFRRSYLSQWPEIPVLTDEIAAWRHLSKAGWDDCAEFQHTPEGPIAHSIDADFDAKGELWVSIGASNGTHLEVVTPPQAGPGTGWVVPKCVENRSRLGELAIDPNGPAGALIDPLEQAGFDVRKVTAREFAQACAQLADDVDGGRVCHLDQPRLNIAASRAERKDLGDGLWRWSRKASPVDIGPLNAVMLARWMARDLTAKTPGYYGSED